MKNTKFGNTTINEKIELARQGYELKVLANDESPIVRLQVLKQGYNVQGFLRDEDPDVSSYAKKLKDAKVYVVARDFGKYVGNVYLYIWENKYEIRSGFYKFTSLEKWEQKYKKELGIKAVEGTAKKIASLIKSA